MTPAQKAELEARKADDEKWAQRAKDADDAPGLRVQVDFYRGEYEREVVAAHAMRTLLVIQAVRRDLRGVESSLLNHIHFNNPPRHPDSMDPTALEHIATAQKRLHDVHVLVAETLKTLQTVNARLK